MSVIVLIVGLNSIIVHAFYNVESWILIDQNDTLGMSIIIDNLLPLARGMKRLFEYLKYLF